MCGRYVSPSAAAIEREFGLTGRDWRFATNFNVAPTQLVPAIRAVVGGAEAVLLRWGLVPFFAHGLPGKYSTINARIETMQTSASYRAPWKRGQRCLLPATGFYEWHLNADGTKQPYYIHLDDQATFAFAGLWDRSVGADGAAIESCTIITLPANPLMADIHNGRARMPALLAADQRAAWLAGTAAEAYAALAPYPDRHMVAYPVGKAVNSPRNNGPDLLQAIS